MFLILTQEITLAAFLSLQAKHTHISVSKFILNSAVINMCIFYVLISRCSVFQTRFLCIKIILLFLCVSQNVHRIIVAVHARRRLQPVCVSEGLTWCLEDLREPNDSEQTDSTAAEPLEGPPVPRCCSSHSSAGRISTRNICCSSSWHLFHTFSATEPRTNRQATPPPAAAAAKRLVSQVVSKKNPRKAN